MIFQLESNNFHQLNDLIKQMFFRSLSLFLNIYSRALFCSLFWEKLSSKLSMDSYFNNFHETKVWGSRNIFLYTLILPPKIYWWRCISSNDAHFVWLIEIPMFPILTKNATSPEEFKNKRGRKKKSDQQLVYYKFTI